MATEINTLKKTRRYGNAVNTLTNQATKYTDQARQYEQSANTWGAIGSGVSSIGGTVASAGTALFGAVANPIVGIGLMIAGLASSIIGGNANRNRAYEAQNKADLANATANNLAGYASALSDRDDILLSATNAIKSERMNLNATYGEAFTNRAFQYYLEKSGLTSDSYSLLTGNFKTFEDIGVGTVSGTREGSIFDELTDGTNFFNNDYYDMTKADTESILDELMSLALSEDTEFSLGIKGNQVLAREELKQALENQTNSIIDAQGNLNINNLEWMAEVINFEESLGKEQASIASSGMRGGTTQNAQKLLGINKAMGEIKRTAQVATLILSLRNTLNNQQQSTGTTVFRYRLAERQAVATMQSNTITRLNSMGMSLEEAENRANKSTASAQIYEDRITNDYINSASTEDYNAIKDAIRE